jgi:glutaredoxin
MTRIVLYGKPGCCLCDEAREAVAEVRERREFDLTEVDVSLDPLLHARYGERIPVVELNGEDAFELHVSAAELEKLLDTVTA